MGVWQPTRGVQHSLQMGGRARGTRIRRLARPGRTPVSGGSLPLGRPAGEPTLAPGGWHVQIESSDTYTTWEIAVLRRPPAHLAMRGPGCRSTPGAIARHGLLTAALLLGACGGETVVPEFTGPPNVDLAQPWATASIDQVGGSSDMVEKGLESARTNDRLLSMLVVKNGRLVVEEYFGNAQREDLHDVRSVTKSVVSALTGLAIERGDIGSVDDPIGGYLDSLVSDLEPEKAAITIEHLLTMASGLEWDESGGFGDYTEWIQSDDRLGYILDKPLVAAPGTRYNYNSGAVHLLGVVLEQATGMRLPELADELLFSRIGISRSRWEPFPDGFHNGGAGLDLRPRDLARFGQLYLQKGASAGRPIVPEEWVARSSVVRFDWRFSSGRLAGISYGFLWWVVPGVPGPLYFAWGFGGQYVVVVPELYLVIVTTNNWRGVGAAAGRYERQTMDVLVDYIIPAFR